MTKEKIIDKFKKYNKVVLDCKYINNKNRTITTMDVLGYKYLENLKKIKYTNNIKKFSIFNPYTIYNLKLFIKINKIKVILISEEVLKNEEKYKFKCLKCTSEFDMAINNFTVQGQRCPYCCDNPCKVNTTNSIRGKAPYLIKYLKYEEDADKYTPYSCKSIKMKCPDCGTEKTQSINRLHKQGLACNSCSDGISVPNKFMFNLLKLSNIDFEFEKSFEWSKNKRYDFYIPSSNKIIEMHGKQHYSTKYMSRSLVEEQNNDKIKENLAKTNNINDYIIINCNKVTFNYIISNIDIDELKLLSKNDYLYAWELSQKSFMPQVWKLWNEGITTLEISKELKLSRVTVIKYLKNGNLLNKCEYDSKKEYSKNSSKNGKLNAKKIGMYSLNGDLVKAWDSLAECAFDFNLKSYSYITSLCKNNKVYKKKYRFKFLKR